MKNMIRSCTFGDAVTFAMRMLPKVNYRKKMQTNLFYIFFASRMHNTTLFFTLLHLMQLDCIRCKLDAHTFLMHSLFHSFWCIFLHPMTVVQLQRFVHLIHLLSNKGAQTFAAVVYLVFYIFCLHLLSCALLVVHQRCKKKDLTSSHGASTFLDRRCISKGVQSKDI